MADKYINRYHSFCSSLNNLKKSVTADPSMDFVLEGTVQNFNLTFDISWKVMKDILIKKMEILDFAIGSPREVLQTAFANGLIGDDVWLKMLRTRNCLAYDYDGEIAKESFYMIISDYYKAFLKLKKHIEPYYQDGFERQDTFANQ